LGVPEGDARAVAGLMVEADLLGYDTHGLFRLRQYVNRLRAAAPTPQPTAPRDARDRGDGAGRRRQRAGPSGDAMACDLAMTKARAPGIGWVGVRGNNHAGPAALYVRPQAAAGMIGLCAAVGSANHVAPWGGTDLLLGTNPIAIAAPSGGDDPFVLDMATTVAAVGKIKTLIQRGEMMPEGWMVGRDGQPLTDPAGARTGSCCPSAGPRAMAVARHRPAGGRAERRGLRVGRGGFHRRYHQPHQHRPVRRRHRHRGLHRSRGLPRDRRPGLCRMRASDPLPGHDPVRVPGDGREAARQGLISRPARG
jgi:LDH2 family malate/lactate/ureidoglycolate dehydrogenase